MAETESPAKSGFDPTPTVWRFVAPASALASHGRDRVPERVRFVRSLSKGIGPLKGGESDMAVP